MNNTLSTRLLDAGGKPSTWFPPEGLVEHIHNKVMINNIKTTVMMMITMEIMCVIACDEHVNYDVPYAMARQRNARHSIVKPKPEVNASGKR